MPGARSGGNDVEKIKLFFKMVGGFIIAGILGIFYLLARKNISNDRSGIAGMGRNLESGKAAQRERKNIERERQSGIDSRQEAIRERQENLSERERIEREREKLAKRKLELLERIKNRAKK